MIPIPVHPLLRQFVPADKTIFLCCERVGLARAWASVHGVRSDGWRWLDPAKLACFPKNRAQYAVMIGDVPKARLDAVRAAGLKPISGEGFRY